MKSFTQPPQYKEMMWDNYVFLLKLMSPIYGTSIPLNFNASKPQTGDELVVVGMGQHTKAGNLSFALCNVTIPVADQKEFADAYSTIGCQIMCPILLCAGDFDKSSCKGDWVVH